MAKKQITQSRIIRPPKKSKWPLATGLISRTIVYPESKTEQPDTFYRQHVSLFPFNDTYQRGGVYGDKKKRLRSSNFYQLQKQFNSNKTPEGLELGPIFTPGREPYIDQELYVPRRKFGGNIKF